MVGRLLAVHADIGAAKNIVKNVCLLDGRIFFPAELEGLSRLEYLKKFLYPSDYTDWFACEYRLKNYTKFGISMDLGDVRLPGIDPLHPVLAEILQHKDFICDVMQHDTAVSIVQQPFAQVLAIAPTTMFGLNWQIRAYTMKYGADRMFNFTFEDTAGVDRFIQKHGQDTWVKVNLVNFYDKVRERRRILRRSGLPIMPMEWIIFEQHWDTLFDFLDSFFAIHIPRSQAHEIMQQWSSLHWPVESTDDWEYRNIFKQYRTKEICDLLALCESI